jgi:exonuclease III
MLKILQYNVNKSRNKVLASLLRDPNIQEFDIIAIQEPWRNPYDWAAYNPRETGFHLVDKREKTARVCTLVNKRISVTSWTEQHHSGDWQTISLRLADETQPNHIVNIHNVYNPPPESHATTAPSETLQALRRIAEIPGEHAIVGDFNLHHPLWTTPDYPHRHHLADHLLESMRNAGAELALPTGTITREAQRGDTLEQTTIDLVFLTPSLIGRLIQCDTRRDLEQSSDHLPIATIIETANPPTPQARPMRRAWEKMDVEKFRTTIRNQTQAIRDRPLKSREAINTAVGEFTQATSIAIASSTPWIKLCRASKGWWTPECRDAIKETRQLRRYAREAQTQEAWQAYIQAKDRKGKVIAKAKRKEFREHMREACESPTNIWRIARWAKRRAQGERSTVSIPTLRRGAREAHEARDKAELLRETHFPPQPEVDMDDVGTYAYPEPVSMPTEITEGEVTNAICATRKDKAPGPDGIPNRVLQLITGETAALIRDIFQACLDQGVHPDHFKETTVVMLKKPGKADYTDPSAYRPISLLNTLGKALEAVISNRIRFLAEKHALLPPTQMGARTQRSTETALTLLTEQIHTIWGANKPKVASMLCLDVKGAFDNVSHARLTHNLRKRRIPTQIVQWIADFLRDRRAEIRIADFTLESRAIDAGIPQGSPISPILYLFYNADLLEICQNRRYRTNAIGFVDDVNILTYGASTEGNCRNLEHIHNACETWARRHGSKFAPAKYELIHFTRKPKRFNMSAKIKIAGTEIAPSKEVKILGVRADAQLKWQAQIRAVEAQAARLLSAAQALTGSIWGASQDATLKVYKTMVRPALTYGGNTWFTPTHLKGARKGVVKRLKAIQGRFLRLATGAYRATATEALEIETFIPPLDIYLERMAAKALVRDSVSQANSIIEASRKRIREELRGKRGRQARVRKTPHQRKEQWLAEANIKTDELEPRPAYERAPWQEANPMRNASEEQTKRRQAALHKIDKLAFEKWRERWINGTTGAHLRTLAQTPDKKVRKLHTNRRKAESSLLTQLRTGKIGFNDFLCSRGVPQIQSRRCTCGMGDMTVRHVILTCQDWAQERNTYLGETERDLKTILCTREKATAAIRMILATGILPQFKTIERTG